MLYKTYESDRDGKLVICPSLEPPKRKLFRRLARFVFSFGRKEDGKRGGRSMGTAIKDGMQK